MNSSLHLAIEAYKRGNYDLLNLFDKQRQAIEVLQGDEINELLYGGSVRSGKSWLLSIWQIMNRLTMDGSVGMIGREELTKLKDTTQKTFFKVVKEEFAMIENEDYIFHAGKQSIDFFNGSSIFFRELKFLQQADPEFDRIGSYDLTDIGIDEAQQIYWKAINVLKGRLSVLSGKNWTIKNGVKTFIEWRTIPKALYTCNPAKNWIYTQFYKPSITNTLEPHNAFVPALPNDNPYVEQSFIDNLKKADKITRERLLYGNFDYDDDPNSLCEWDAICDVFNNDHVEKKPNDKYLVSDLAMMGRDKFITMYWEGFAGKIAFVKDKNTGKEIEDALRDEKVKRNVPNRRIIADSDGLGQFLSSYLENIREFHGGAASINKIYGNLKDECGFKLAEMINSSEIRIICDREYEEEIKNQISICLKRSANVDDEKKRLIKKSEMKEKLGHSPDFLDLLLMRMLPEVKKQYDVFA